MLHMHKFNPILHYGKQITYDVKRSIRILALKLSILSTCNSTSGEQVKKTEKCFLITQWLLHINLQCWLQETHYIFLIN